MSLSRKQPPISEARWPSDLARSKRATRRILAGVFLAVMAAGLWAVWPIPAPPAGPALTALASPAPAVPQLQRALDVDVFESPVWTVAAVPKPPPPAPPPAPEPPPPPLRLQLLGIVRESDVPTPVFRAALYDPDTDKILVVGSGDLIGVRTVKQVLADRVLFALGPQVQTLHLREDLASPPPAASPRRGRTP